MLSKNLMLSGNYLMLNSKCLLLRVVTCPELAGSFLCYFVTGEGVLGLPVDKSAY